jgi:hypothetical protein
MLSLSLGAICPRPVTAWPGTIVIPARATEEVPINPLRLILFVDPLFMIYLI